MSRALSDELLDGIPIRVVDVGASGGLAGRWSKFTSRLTAVLVEPDPREYERLRRAGSDGHVMLNVALSDRAGTIDLRLCRKQEVSSVYEPNREFLGRFPEPERFEVLRRARVQADTLASQLALHNVADADFLKIDAQGHELAILRGAGSVMGQVIGLEVEVEFAPLYQGQPLFCDVHQFVCASGLELFDVRRYYWARNRAFTVNKGRKGQLVFGDALYLRAPEVVAAMFQRSEAKLVRAICVYLVYGYFDLAVELLELLRGDGMIAPRRIILIEELLRRQRRRDFLPPFRGRKRIATLFRKVARAIDPKPWYYGTDDLLGNE